jgi:hypothetical protein
MSRETLNGKLKIGDFNIKVNVVLKNLNLNLVLKFEINLMTLSREEALQYA